MMEPTEYDKYVEPDEASVAEWNRKVALRKLAREAKEQQEIKGHRRALMAELMSKLKTRGKVVASIGGFFPDFLDSGHGQPNRFT